MHVNTVHLLNTVSTSISLYQITCITIECIVTCMCFMIVLNGLYILAITSFSSDTKLFQATINTATLQASFLLIA